jgi:transcriptional regulator with XRE-family HTH domain
MRLQAEITTVGHLPSLLDIRTAVRRTRRAREWSLDALSDKSGVDRAVIHRIENVRKYPKYEPGIETLRRIVEGFGLSLADFFGVWFEGLVPNAHGDGARGERAPSGMKGGLAK